MPQIYVNYKYNKKEDKYTIIDNGRVYVDLPIAVMQDGIDYDEILIVPINDVMTVVDKEEYLSKNKLFHLAIDEDGKHIHEDPQGKIEIYLPKDTPIEKLIIMNGQLLLEEQEEIQKEGRDLNGNN